MKSILIALLAATTFWHANATEATWLTDSAKAQTKAKAENKIVLMDFTGSDWCGWCIKFKKDVLDTKEFQEYAATNLVLVEVDFPRSKEIAAELKKGNAGLQQKYKVDGFPTFVILNQDGKEIGRQVGYLKGGPKAFIEMLEKLKKG